MATNRAMQVDRKTWWWPGVTDGTVTLKHRHRKRGRAAMATIAIMPRDRGVLVHDCRAADFGHEDGSHALCGSRLPRELTVIVDAGGDPGVG